MKTKAKLLGLILCMALLTTTAVLGTVAYLTAQDSVTNTFTVGAVAITLDEAAVGLDGTVISGADRVKENAYKLMPGHTYTKDPTVHFEAGSEASWLFVEVENGIAGIESETDSIASQIVANGWIALEGNEGVYYREIPAITEGVLKDYVVFERFTIDGGVTQEELEAAVTADTKIKITAYAVQADGFDTAADAWKTGLGK